MSSYSNNPCFLLSIIVSLFPLRLDFVALQSSQCIPGNSQGHWGWAGPHTLPLRGTLCGSGCSLWAPAVVNKAPSGVLNSIHPFLPAREVLVWAQWLFFSFLCLSNCVFPGQIKNWVHKMGGKLDISNSLLLCRVTRTFHFSLVWYIRSQAN